MHRISMRLAACALAVVLCLCAMDAIKSYQGKAPFDATAFFRLNVTNSTLGKAQLADELASLGDKHHATIFKVSPDEREYLTKSDIIVFSGTPHSDQGLVVGDDGSLTWLDRSITGDLISYQDMGTRALSGDYCASGSEGLLQAIKEWADARGVALRERLIPALSIPILAKAMLSSPMGLLILSAGLFTMASVLFMAQKRWRASGILVIGGIPYWRVRAETALGTLAALSQGMLIGLLLFSGYVTAFDGGFERLRLLASRGLATVLALAVTGLLVGSLLSAIMVPPFRQLAQRRPISALMTVLGTCLTAGGLVVVALGVFAGVGVFQTEQMMLSQARMYEGMTGATRVRLRAPAPEDGNAGDDRSKAAIGDLLTAAEGAGDLLVSMDVGQSTSLTASDLGPFDGYAVVNRAYLESIGVGVETEGRAGSIRKLPEGDVPPMARQLKSLWIGDAPSGGLSFWSYQGDGLLTLGPNTSQGGENVVHANPLVLLIDDPIASLNYDGLIMPMVSTGNIFFSGQTDLDTLIDGAGAREFIISIDRLFELAQQMAQISAGRIRVLLASIIAAGAVVVSMAAQTSLAWCSLRKRRIFALRSSGRSYIRIILEGMGRAALASAFAVFISLLVRVVGAVENIFVAVAVPICLYMACQVAFRRAFAASVFRNMAARREV